MERFRERAGRIFPAHSRIRRIRQQMKTAPCPVDGRLHDPEEAFIC